MGELESLKGQMQAMGMSIAKAVSDGALIINHDTDPFRLGKVKYQVRKTRFNREYRLGSSCHCDFTQRVV